MRISSLVFFLIAGTDITSLYGFETSILTTESYIKVGLSYPKGMKIASSFTGSGLNLSGKL